MTLNFQRVYVRVPSSYLPSLLPESKYRYSRASFRFNTTRYFFQMISDPYFFFDFSSVFLFHIVFWCVLLWSQSFEQFAVQWFQSENLEGGEQPEAVLKHTLHSSCFYTPAQNGLNVAVLLVVLLRRTTIAIYLVRLLVACHLTPPNNQLNVDIACRLVFVLITQH